MSLNRNYLITFFFSILTLSTSFSQNTQAVEGLTELVIQDFFDQKRSETKIYLHLNQVGDSTLNPDPSLIKELRFEAGKPHLRTGDSIKATCSNSMQESFCTVTHWSLLSPKVVKKQQTLPIQRKALWIIVHYKDLKNKMTREQGIHMMEANRTSFLNSSSGALDFPLDVNGDGKPDLTEVTIDYTDAESCSPSKVAGQVNLAIEAQGYDFKLYQHFIYMQPTARCGQGLGTMGCGSRCGIWIGEPLKLRFYLHELGHNLNMAHASSDPNNDGTIDGEYGDFSCPMGGGWGFGFPYFNAPHAHQMQWINQSAGQVQPITNSGIYIISALNLVVKENQVQALTLPNKNGSYYLSYRPGSIKDPVDPQYRSGVNIHSYQYHSYANTLFIRALKDGEDYILGSTRIRQISKTDEQVTLSIDTDYQNCVETAPSIIATPSSQEGPAGSTLAYTLTIKNHNSQCSPDIFNLTANKPTTFSYRFTPEQFALNSAESKNVVAEVTINNSARVGKKYTSSIQVTNIGNPAFVASTAVDFLVKADTSKCVEANPCLSVTPMSQEGVAGSTVKYLLQITNNNSSECSPTNFNFSTLPAEGLSFAFNPPRITLNPGATASTTFELTSATSVIPGRVYPLTLTAANEANPSFKESVGATYSVKKVVTPCVDANPLVSVAPLLQSGPRGGTRPYTMTVRNMNTAQCSPAIFNLSGDNLSVFNHTFNPSSIKINSGELATVAVQLTISRSIQIGTFSSILSATNASNANFKDGAKASYEIKVPQSCTEANPTLTVIPVTQEGAAGSTVKYILSLINNNSAECEASTFQLSTPAADGLSSKFNPLRLTLNSGATVSATFEITSATSVTPGRVYPLTLTAVNIKNRKFRESVSANYIVKKAATVHFKNHF